MTEVLSPELALVDPDAAEQARLALPEVALFEDTLRPAPSEYAELRRLFEEPDEPSELEPARRRGRVLRLAALAVAVVAAAVAAVFSFAPDVRTQVGDALPDSAPSWLKPSKPAAVAPTRTEASAPAARVPVSKPQPPPAPTAQTPPQTKAQPPHTKLQAPPRTTPQLPAPTKTQPPPQTKAQPPAHTKPQAPARTTPQPPPARTIPDFVWVAAPGAAGYRIEFRRGTRVVYSTTTKAPRLHVPAARLPPGKYRWQVRVVGRDAAAPIVDAAVSIG